MFFFSVYCICIFHREKQTKVEFNELFSRFIICNCVRVCVVVRKHTSICIRFCLLNFHVFFSSSLHLKYKYILIDICHLQVLLLLFLHSQILIQQISCISILFFSRIRVNAHTHWSVFFFWMNIILFEMPRRLYSFQISILRRKKFYRRKCLGKYVWCEYFSFGKWNTSSASI